MWVIREKGEPIFLIIYGNQSKKYDVVGPCGGADL
jgi:hypothetical protein